MKNNLMNIQKSSCVSKQRKMKGIYALAVAMSHDIIQGCEKIEDIIIRLNKIK